MKHLALVLMMSLMTAACSQSSGGSDSASSVCSSFEGGWHTGGMTTDHLEIDAACHGTTTRCGYDFTFTTPDAQNKSYVTFSQSNNQASCASVGTYQCITRFRDDIQQLEVNCGTDHSFYFHN